MFFCQNLTLSNFFKDPATDLGINPQEPSPEDMDLYERFLKFDFIDKPRGKFKNLETIKGALGTDIFLPWDYKVHNYEKDLLPMPSNEDKQMYHNYLDWERIATVMPSEEDQEMYREYVKLSFPQPMRDFHELLESPDLSVE